MNAIATIGPLAVNVQADVWKAYSAGVFSGCTNKSNIDINHVVQLVGYGTDSSFGDYWLVRSSPNPSVRTVGPTAAASAVAGLLAGLHCADSSDSCALCRAINRCAIHGARIGASRYLLG